MKVSELSLMIFAAGFGTRMGALTKTCPKPLLPVAGRPLIEYALDVARSNQVSKVVVNAHYKHEAITQYFSKSDVRVLIEWPNVLETGGGCKAALPYLQGNPLITLNSDAIWSTSVNLNVILNLWDPNKMDALLLLVPLEWTKGRGNQGDFSLANSGQLKRGGGHVYTGLQLISREVVASVREDKFSFNVLWDRALDSDRLYGCAYPHWWCDVGSPRGILEAEAFLCDQMDGSTLHGFKEP